ncbi:unnamed protein product [Cochlearia groenlandica]
MHKTSSKIRPLHLRVALAEMTECRCPSIRVGVRAPMSEHPGRCPSAYVRASGSVSERLCPSIRAPMSEHPGQCSSAYVRASGSVSEHLCPSIRAPMSSIRAHMSEHPSIGVRAPILPMSERRFDGLARPCPY